MQTAKNLIEEIFERRKMSIRALAIMIKARPSTIAGIMKNEAESTNLKTYMRLLEYKNKLDMNVR